MHKVLIVDDSRATLLALKQQLGSELFAIDTAQSATEAMKLLDVVTPDCILTDYEMPEVDGPSFCRMLKGDQRLKSIPVIVLTSLTSAEHLLTAIEAGADDFISKHADIRIVTAKIAAMIRIRRYHEELTRLRRAEGIKQIIATYNHEFNNPLTIALGNLDWLKKNLDNPDQQTRLARLSNALERMAELVRKIRGLRDYVESEYDGNESLVNIKFDSSKKTG